MCNSAARSQSLLESKLEALQCHFTWALEHSSSKLFHLREKLEDIGTEGGHSWLGHIYNLQGYIHHQLGFIDNAQSFFSKSAEAFRQMRNTVSDEGPWSVVNYGNLAWLHHHRGEEAESQAYLSKVSALTDKYPSPSQDELHPEICAEKAWTLMNFGQDQKLLSAEYFRRAIRMQPDMVEWHTSHILVLVSTLNHRNKGLMDEIFEKIKIAKQHDPENLYLCALCLEASAKSRKKMQDEVRELGRKTLRKPVSSYSGIKPILKLYRMYVSFDEAIDLAEELVERHPDERYLKKCAAICYSKRILLDKHSPLEHSMISRAISLCQEVISLYPHSSLKRKITLANLYGHLHRQDEGDQLYKELLDSELDPEPAQMLYNYYAKYAHLIQKESYKSIEYYMKAAAIPTWSVYRENSLRILERIKDRNRNRMCGDIEKFLDNLQL